MDYEKKYKEALELMKDCIPDADGLVHVRPQDIFPELKESEDERMKQGIIRIIKGNMPDNDFRKKYIDWLEKQGEQKPADKVEPKFKVGDWVVNKFGYVCHIDSFDKKNYQVSNDNGYFPISKQNEMHLWNIQDAKDGDVLVCEDFGYTSLMLFKSFSNGRISLHCWHNSQTNNFHINTDIALRKDANIYPATKEQRDLLFQKMKEAGYEWDADKKKLKKISTQEIEPTPIFRIGDVLKRKGKDYTFRVDRIQGGYYHSYCNHGAFFPIEEQGNWELVEHNSAWTPMDEQHVENLLAIIEGHGYPREVAWLNSLEDRIQSKQGEQKPSEWSEEDEEVLDGLIKHYEDGHVSTPQNRKAVSWLKSLKDRVQPQPKQEWSNWDKTIIESIEALCDEKIESVVFQDVKEHVNDIKDWLKSLKDRYTWKPSDEHLVALRIAIGDEQGRDCCNILRSLLKDLKSL